MPHKKKVLINDYGYCCIVIGKANSYSYKLVTVKGVVYTEPIEYVNRRYKESVISLSEFLSNVNMSSSDIKPDTKDFLLRLKDIIRRERKYNKNLLFIV